MSLLAVFIWQDFVFLRSVIFWVACPTGFQVFNLGDFGNLGSSGNLLPLAVPPPAFPRSPDSFGCLAFQLLKLQARTKNKLKV